MNLYLDRNKTLMPRIDSIFVLSRVIVWLTINWYFLSGRAPDSSAVIFQAITWTYAAHLLLFIAALKGRADIKLAFLSGVVYDLLMVPLVVLYSGGVDSSFYLIFLMTISGAIYVLTFPFSLTAAGLSCLGYLLVIRFDLSVDNMFHVVLRMALGLVYFLALSYASDHVRRSEKRMLRLFNTLNKRTSELEKSQAQLQLIYENTRALASILDAQGVVREVIRLMDDLLQLNFFAIISRDEDGGMYYTARVDRHDKNFEQVKIDPVKMELVRRVCEMEEPVRLKDISHRDDYTPMNQRAKSVMIVPMISHGTVSGVLTAESSERDRFTEKDIQMLSVVARSAALALDNAILHKKTEELTTMDELTETYNYRYFEAKLDEERRRAFRYEMPLSLVMVDIDWFKNLNDTYGHENGNLVLKQLSAIIKTCIRDVDVFARYGGEEFAIILPQTGLGEASIIGERIRSRVEEAIFKLAGNEGIRLTVSVGVSCFPENGQGPKQLVRVADEALYQAKGEGRNLVRCI